MTRAQQPRGALGPSMRVRDVRLYFPAIENALRIRTLTRRDIEAEARRSVWRSAPRRRVDDSCCAQTFPFILELRAKVQDFSRVARRAHRLTLEFRLGVECLRHQVSRRVCHLRREITSQHCVILW